jgi:hypothetical protein
MGLDQYGGWLETPTKQQELHSKLMDDGDNFAVGEFDWRKHAKLQEFMEILWYKKYKNTETFNCQNMPLDREDILTLQAAVKGEELPESEGGMFFGHEFQDVSAKEYRDQDLEFCAKALKWLDEGKTPYYSCWW